MSRLGIFAKTFAGTTAEAVLTAARDAGYGCVQFDPANMVERPDIDQRLLYAEAADLVAGRIAMAHAKDRDATGAVVPAGAGIIDFDAFFAQLARVGFTGPVVTHGLAAADAAGVARFLSQKLAG